MAAFLSYDPYPYDHSHFRNKTVFELLRVRVAMGLISAVKLQSRKPPSWARGRKNAAL